MIDQLSERHNQLYLPRSPMTQYTLLLPLRHNNGSPMQPERLRQVQHEIILRAGGLTRHFPGTGFWVGSTRIYRDLVLPIQIVVPTSPATEAWILTWTAQAAELLEQYQLFLLSQPACLLKPS